MFTKNYLEDKDLEFFSRCSNEDLLVFADLLVFDTDGKKRYSETLSNTRLYTAYYPNNLKLAWTELVHEFQLFGGDTAANLMRGHGVPYKEILRDVCDKKKVSYNKNTSVQRMETYLLQKLLEDVLEELSDEQIYTIFEELKLDPSNYKGEEAMKDAIAAALMSPQLVSFLINLITRTLFPRLLGMAVAGVAMPRVIGALVPALNVVMGAWLLKDLTGPAFRVTIPGVILIIYMRTKYLNESKKVE